MAAEAQDQRHVDVKAMDYFALQVQKGGSPSGCCLSELNSLPIFTAPGCAEIQLKLMEAERVTGHVGLTQFLADGLTIEETQ